MSPVDAVWEDDRHHVRTLPKLHRGRTRVQVYGPTGVPSPTVRPGSGRRSVSAWRTYRRGIVRVYREQAQEALGRLVGLDLPLTLAPRRGGLSSYFVTDVDLGVDFAVRIKDLDT